jgi:hypothetical protein
VTAGVVAADRLGLSDAGRRKLDQRRREIVDADAILEIVELLLPTADQRLRE